MRNLKRVLSLSLASIMLFGMMVVGASAVEGYPDVDAEDNVEAIDVLQQVEVMVGFPEDGGFHPDDPVTRAQMIVILAKLLDLDYNYYATSCPFTDVPDWAKGYVGAAYANKVAYGRGDGIFDPDSTITPVEASAFLMRALGYFQYSNDYSDGFELATVRQGTSIGIYDGVSSSASEPMTRNQVARMVLNTLESGMVQPDGNTINLTTPDGSVLTGKVNYVYVTSSKDFATAIHDVKATSMGSTNEGSIVELGEQLYNGDLKLYDNNLDDFGRPSRHWEYDGTSIGTYIKKDLLKEEYTAKVTGKDLYELLGSEILRDYDFEITIDGETAEDILNHTTLTVVTNNSQYKNQYYFNKTAIRRDNTNQVGGTGNGVLTQVFIDGNKKEVYIAIINTYLARANADYNTNRDEASFTIYNLRRVPVAEGGFALVKDSKMDVTPMTVLGEEFDVAGIKLDDIRLVHVADNEIKEMWEPDIVDEVGITAFKTGTYVVADGSQINYAHTARYDANVLNQYVDTNMKDKTYRIFLDPYGYLIGIKELESENHYVFLTGINSITQNLKDQTAIGNVVFLDGTSQNVTINLKDSRNAEGLTFNRSSDTAPATYDTYNVSNAVYAVRYDTKVSSLMNTWCTYSVDEAGIYTLKEVANTWQSFQGAKLGQSHMGGTYKADGSNNDSKTAKTFYLNNNTNPTAGTAAAVASSTGAGLNWTEAAGADNKYATINKGHVYLDGIPKSPWSTVYGNNDTVYLSAEIAYLSAAKHTLSGDMDDPAVIITGADTVSIGVQDVELTAWNAQAVVREGLVEADRRLANNKLKYMNVSDGVYALFDNDGYVIAAMVVGADDSSSISYAWVSSSDMSREGLIDGKWEYSRDVIIDGQKVTLTELETVGDYDPEIKQNSLYRNVSEPLPTVTAKAEAFSYWWAVKTKADGTVKNADRINIAVADNTSSYNYVYDINDDTRKGTTILNQSFNMRDDSGVYDLDRNYIFYDTREIDTAAGYPTNSYTVRVAGNTLQVEGATGMTRGYAVSAEANVVLVKDEKIIRNGEIVGWNYKGDIQYFTNDREANGLKQAVNNLTAYDNFRGYIAAVIKDGRAETVIIYDKSQNNIVNTGTTPTATDRIAVNQPNTGYLDVYYLDDDVSKPWTPKSYEVEDAIRAYMVKDGLDVISVTFNAAATSDNTEVTYNRNGRTQVGYYQVTLHKVDTRDPKWNNGEPWNWP